MIKHPEEKDKVEEAERAEAKSRGSTHGQGKSELAVQRVEQANQAAAMLKGRNNRQLTYVVNAAVRSVA
jgi:hypothetical protein